MKLVLLGGILSLALAVPALAQEAGDVAAGEKEFRKCKACHKIQTADGEEIFKGGKTGPNLWNVVGRKIASVADFRYGDGILAAAEANPDLVWTRKELAAYVTDPNAWLQEKTGDSGARSKMTFRLKKAQADIVAYLASVSPDAPDK